MRGLPLLDGNRCILRLHRSPFGQLGNTDVWPFSLRSTGRQLRDAPSDWRRSSFALPGLRRFHICSCHARPDRRGHIQRITHWLWLLRSSQCCLRHPALRFGRPRTAWPGTTAFPCSAFDTGGVRSALLHRQPCECSAGPRSTTRTRLLALLAEPYSASYGSLLLQCLKAFNSLTISSDSSAPPV